MFLKRKNFFDEPKPTPAASTPTDGAADVPSAEPDVTEAPAKAPVQRPVEKNPASVLPPAFGPEDKRILGQLSLLEKHAREAGRKDLLARIAATKAYLASARFSAAVVGEFNRGKSTLVNELVGKDVIPTGAVPTTQTLIRISGGDDDRLVAPFPQGARAYPLSDAGWDQLERDAALSSLPGELLVRRRCALLNGQALELVDTPGVDSQLPDDLTMAERALASCDCALLVMSAVNPLSETERLFLEESIVARNVPRTMVVLTMLDLVPASQRAGVLAVAQQKLEAFAPGTPLFLAQEGLVGGWEEQAGATAISRQLEAWFEDSDASSRRRGRVLAETRALAEDIASVYQCQLDALDERDKQRAGTLQKNRRELASSGRVAWDALEVDLLNRCNSNFSRIRQMADERRCDLEERLRMELSRTNSPKDWWERDCPYRIKVEMTSFGNALENTLQSCYTRDMNWLNRELEERYQSKVPPEARRIAEREVFRGSIEQSRVELEDMKRSRLISRVGTGAATVSAYALGSMLGLGPVGILVSTSGGILSEVAMGRRVEKQRTLLEGKLSSDLTRVFDQGVASVEEGMRELYLDATRDLQAACKTWAEAACAAVDKAESTSDTTQARRGIEDKLAELATIGR